MLKLVFCRMAIFPISTHCRFGSESSFHGWGGAGHLNNPGGCGLSISASFTIASLHLLELNKDLTVISKNGTDICAPKMADVNTAVTIVTAGIVNLFWYRDPHPGSEIKNNYVKNRLSKDGWLGWGERDRDSGSGDVGCQSQTEGREAAIAIPLQYLDGSPVGNPNTTLWWITALSGCVVAAVRRSCWGKGKCLLGKKSRLDRLPWIVHSAKTQ